nr:DNA repair helicase [Enterococcus diestrammenae]
MEVKIVQPRNELGMFHEKVSIFIDEADNLVVTNGSNNESSTAVNFNIESFSVFRSWFEGQEKFCEAYLSRFDKSWNGQINNYNVLNIYEAVSEEVFNLYESDRSIEEMFQSLRELRRKKNGKLADADQIPINEEHNSYHALNFKPYDFQIKAANSWLSKRRGIISFATGTGKTKTAILCIQSLLLNGYDRPFVIVVPDKTLLNQWSDELTPYGLNTICCYSEEPGWERRLKDFIDIIEFDDPEALFIITTTSTFRSNRFQRQLSKLKNNFIFLADECHRLGTEQLLKILPDVEYRLGLSATPDIYMDEAKTKKLFSYFGGKIAEFSLMEAINDGFLVSYDYYPIEVSLTDEEMCKYKELTHKVIRMIGSSDESTFSNLPHEVQMILFKRSRILYGASNKITKLSNLLETLKNESHMLVYCGVTSPADDDLINEETGKMGISQLEKVNDLLHSKSIVAAQYTQEEDLLERKKNIEQFKKGFISTLVAIKCLDEGVDIPEISTGIIMASSGNPREFIQRRGRLLRKSEGKDKAVIYDMIVVGEDESYQGINRTEMKRVYEFAKVANNWDELNVKYHSEFEMIDLEMENKNG